MKNYAKVLVFAAIVALVVVPAHAALHVDKETCDLIGRMQEIFRTLRILAFVGAGFYMAGWAWDYISKGEAKMDDMKKKGIGLLVGFTLLFIIGVVISFVLSVTGPGDTDCAALKDPSWSKK